MPHFSKSCAKLAQADPFPFLEYPSLYSVVPPNSYCFSLSFVFFSPITWLEIEGYVPLGLCWGTHDCPRPCPSYGGGAGGLEHPIPSSLDRNRKGVSIDTYVLPSGEKPELTLNPGAVHDTVQVQASTC